MSPPLDQKQVTRENPQTGKQEKIPALHPQWKEMVQFVLYQAPPLDLSDAASFGEWIERCTFLEDDLHQLLQQPHDKFWCQVIFDETLQRSIDSYLNHAPRSHDILQDLPPDARAKHAAIHRLFFITCLRMATYKESKDCHLTPSVFGEILYENFIFDIPKIMDMCVLFGRGNAAIVSKMVENIFEQQPKYSEDLQVVVPTVLEVFDNIQKKCGLKVGSTLSPVKLSESSGGRNVLLSMPITDFQDVILYLADTCATLWAFLDIYPKGAVVFSQQDFPIRLVQMYENLVPVLKQALRSRDWSLSSVRPLLEKKVRSAQHHLIQVFRQIVFQTYLQVAIENRNADTVEEAVETYVHLLTFVLGERRFAANYDHLFPFMDDIDLLSQTAYTIDEMRTQFLEQGFSEARAAYRPRKPRKAKSDSPVGGDLAGPSASAGAGLQYEEESYQAPDNDDDYGACAPRITGVELDSLVTSVRDLLPHLGEGFIEVALEEFGYDVEKVINSVLEERLPAALLELDRSMPRQRKQLTEDDVLSERANVFDNDEFDIFNRTDVDLSKIHRGKKDKGLDMALLNEKEELDTVRPLFEKYGTEDRPSMYDDNADYDDEYDDTYDDHNVGADDADEVEEERRPFAVPRILASLGKTHSPAEDEDEDDNCNQGPRPDHFIEDPAKIRERAEQRRLSKQQHQSKRAPGQQPQGQGPRYDVKGKPKGQGQEKDVVRNRAFKEKNKATRVHHNRKNLADKKRKV